MPEFEVTYTQSEIYVVTVVADDEEHAQNIVGEMADNDSLGDYHSDSDSDFVVYEVEELDNEA